MDLQLEGKRALVTGSSMGIGEAIAHTLAQEGASIVVTAIESELCEEVASSIRDAGGQAWAVAGDIGKDEDVERIVSVAREQAGGIDILVNNAGILSPGEWLEVTPEAWTHVHNVNVLGSVRLIRALVPDMKKSGWGRVVNISSAEAIQPFPIFPHYAATKAAIVNMTVSLARSLDRTGITVNTVTPGVIHTKAVEEWYRQVAQQFGWGDDWDVIEPNVLKTFLDNPVGRFGKVEEVAAVVAFLASSHGAFVNGANIRVDGGSTLSIN